MDKMGRAARELREMDDLAARNSPVHRLHPLAKLLATVAYIGVTVSFHKYDLSGLAVMLLWPVALFQLSGIPLSTCFYKLRLVLPLVMAVGLFNPFFDRSFALRVGGLAITGGMISMATLMLKGVLCLMASFLLMATTRIDALCESLRRLRLPGMLVTLLLLTYRYAGLMVEEVGVMTEAYHLRAPGQKGIHVSAWGSFLGQLLLRSMDRAEELYTSMQLRGFAGDFYYARGRSFSLKDGLFLACSVGCFVLFRAVDAARLLGAILVR